MELTPKGVIVTGYKATDENMRCRGFQFEMNKWFTHKEDIELCKTGFHFCEYPSDLCFFYANGRIFEIEAEFVSKETGSCASLKYVCKKIRFIKELFFTGDRNSGDGNTGDRNSGDGNTGDWNSGDGNTGDWNAGNWNTGDRNSGDGNTGDWNAGNWNTGDWNAGDCNTGNWNTGNRNTGDRNTGNRNTGNRNNGNGNTGDGNTGDWNAGNWNTGNGNVCDYHTGCLNTKKPSFYIFDRKADINLVDFNLIKDLCLKLSKDEDFNYDKYLNLPNASVDAIKKLHNAHIERRKIRKENE